MAKKRATLTDLLNDLTFKVIYDKFRLLATNTFEISGLPEGIEEKHVENFLFDYGKAIFFRDPNMSYMCLEAQDSGQLNVYGEPLGYHAHGFNYHKYYDVDDCVIIENNSLRMSTYNFLMFYVNKITEAERTMDVNIKSIKTPVIITCNDKNELTFKRIFEMVDGNSPVIYADPRIDLDAIKTLKTEAQFMGNDLMDYKKSVENELLTFLGYDNLAVDKKERVNLSEANSNNQITKTFSDLFLESRQKSFDKVNEKYGLNITVKRREVLNDVEPDEASVQHDQNDAGAP